MKIVRVFTQWCPVSPTYSVTFDSVKNQLGFQYPQIKWESRNAETFDPDIYGVSVIPATLALTSTGEVIDTIYGNLTEDLLAQFVMDAYVEEQKQEAERKQLEADSEIEVDYD